MPDPSATWLPSVTTLATPQNVTIPPGTVHALVFIVSGGAGTASAVSIDGDACQLRAASAGTTNGRVSLWDILSPTTGVVPVAVTGADYTTTAFVVCLVDVDISDPRLAVGTASLGAPGAVTVPLSPPDVERLTLGLAWAYGPNGPHVVAGDAAAFVIDQATADSDRTLGGVTSGGDEWGINSTGGTTFAEICAISLRGASDPELAPDDVDVASSMESPTLAQEHVLAPDDMAVAATVDSPALDVGVTLTVAELAVAATFDAPSLTQDHALAPNEATVAIDFESPAPSSTVLLAVAGLDVASLLDGPALTQAHVLVVADMLGALTMDSPTLSLSTLLAPADLLVASAWDSPALVESATLAPADVLVDAALDAIALTQANVLAPAPMLVAVSFDGLALIVAGAVSPAQAHTFPPDIVYRIHAPD